MGPTLLIQGGHGILCTISPLFSHHLSNQIGKIAQHFYCYSIEILKLLPKDVPGPFQLEGGAFGPFDQPISPKKGHRNTMTNGMLNLLQHDQPLMNFITIL